MYVLTYIIPDSVHAIPYQCSLQTDTPKSINRRGSNQSVSNTMLNVPSRTKMLGVGIVGRATGLHGDLRERFDDDDETIIEEEDADIVEPDWRGPLYLSPFCKSVLAL